MVCPSPNDCLLPCTVLMHRYDMDVFPSLPPDVQLEVISEHRNTNDTSADLIKLAGYDGLPLSIQQELLDQARRF